MDSLEIRSAAIVGSCSGGLVSQLVASTYPDRVSALVLISSPASLRDKPAVAAMWEETRPSKTRWIVMWEEFVRSTSPELLPQDFIDTLIAESLKVPVRVWQQTLQGLTDTDVRANLERITAPTLLIAGDEDAFVSDDQQAMLDAIPRARLTLYRGVGHGVHLAKPKRVVSDIVDFLASTTSSP